MENVYPSIVMEKQESPTKNRLEELQDIIKKTPISTDKEFRNKKIVGLNV